MRAGFIVYYTKNGDDNLYLFRHNFGLFRQS